MIEGHGAALLPAGPTLYDGVVKLASTPSPDAGEAERPALGLVAPESPPEGPALFVWHRGLPQRRPDVALVPPEPEAPARAQEPIPQPFDPTAPPEHVPGGEEAPSQDAPAAMGSIAPESAEPPVALRPRPLPPEQVDALLREYLSEPSAGFRSKAAEASQRGPAEASLGDPEEAFQVWRLPTTRQQFLPSRLRAIARSLRRPALVAIAIAAVAAGGANAYRRYLALRPSDGAAHQPRAEPPRPASTPVAAQVASARPTSAAPTLRPPSTPAAALAPIRTSASALRAPTRERAPAAPPKRTQATERPNGEPLVARAATAVSTGAPGASPPAPASQAPPSSPRAAPSEEVRPKLTPTDVISVIRSRGAAFDACVAEWQAREPQLDVNGVKVDLFITIDPSGAVTWSALDIPDIDRSALGACLRGAGEKMTFPRFAGEAIDVRVPLVLGQMPH